MLPTSSLQPASFRCPGVLQRVQRPTGSNDVGMVAWHMTLRTPECPQGRQVGKGQTHGQQ